MQAQYAPHDVDMIQKVGNWDASADEAACVPVAGDYTGKRIDLARVRQFQKQQLRYRSPQQSLVRPPSVPTEVGPVKLRAPENGTSDAKSSRQVAPVQQAIAEPQHAAQPLQPAARGPEQAQSFVAPHLRPVPPPGVPKILQRQNKPITNIVRQSMSSLEGVPGDAKPHSEKQLDVQSVAKEETQSKPVADGAPPSSIESQRKTLSDPTRSEHVDNLRQSPKGKRAAELSPPKSSTPPMADLSDRSANAGNVPDQGAVAKPAQPGPESRHPLLSWDGTWQEAPVDWSDRPLFDTRDKDRLKAMRNWVETNAQETLKNPVTVNTKVPGFGTGEALVVGEKIVLPFKKGIHDTLPVDDDFTFAKKDETAAEAIEKHRARIRVAEKEVRVAEREAKAERRAYREAVREAAAKYVPPPNPHTPRANIYIRPAILDDMGKIAELYNHYIVHSVVASERSPMTAQQWQARWEDARDGKYAFLVAVQARPRGGGYSRRTSEEVVAGFAYADDYGDRESAWRFTCEVQFFVAHWQLRAGVGKSLVDRILTALDPVYVPRNGVQFAGAGNSIQYEQGGERVVAKIMVGIPFAAKDDTDVKWQKEWLKQFDFEELAVFPKMGRKLGKEYVTSLESIRNQQG